MCVCGRRAANKQQSGQMIWDRNDGNDSRTAYKLKTTRDRCSPVYKSVLMGPQEFLLIFIRLYDV